MPSPPGDLLAARQRFIEAMSRIGQFWGFPRAMGAIYGSIYLAPSALCLDELVEQVGVTKGAVSTHVRALERLQMIHREPRLGDRRDFYSADADLWGIVKNVLRQREHTEFDRALRAVGETLALVEGARRGRGHAELAAFYRERMLAMQRFFDLLDSLVAGVLLIDNVRSQALRALIDAGRGMRGRKGQK